MVAHTHTRAAATVLHPDGSTADAADCSLVPRGSRPATGGPGSATRTVRIACPAGFRTGSARRGFALVDEIARPFPDLGGALGGAQGRSGRKGGLALW